MAFRPGDWACPSCGDHQFEKNLQCRKCGTPKPVVSSNRIVAKAGDWICPGCSDVQFERNTVCRKCSTPRPAAGGGQPMAMGGAHFAHHGGGHPGGGHHGGGGQPSYIHTHVASGVTVSGSSRADDWRCPQCNDVQFGKNTACRMCGTAKPAPGGASSAATARSGDWTCPNPSCQDFQFERNPFCRKCGTPKPGAGGAPAPAAAPAMPMGVPAEASAASAEPREDWMCGECGDLQFARNLQCRKCGAPKPKVSTNNIAAKRGDWLCPNPACQDVQFERNHSCRRCGTPKPVGVAQSGLARSPSEAAAAHAQAAAPMAGSAPGGVSADKRPDDWMCAECGDHQFAKNLSCRKCGAPKPTVSTNNIPAKKGDWICPNRNCQDVQFEKNTMCRRCGTPRPGMYQQPVAGMYQQPVAGYQQPVAGYGGCGAPMMAQVPAAGWGQRGCGGCAMAGGGVSNNGQPLKPGDWVCPNPGCQDVQFGKNEVCRKCGTVKPMVSSNKQMFKAGDWICPNPECNDVQFEKNQSCRKCGTAKPEFADAGGVRSRSRSPMRHY